MGLAMLCKTCNHALSSHFHQAFLNEEGEEKEEYTDTKIDEHKRAQFEHLASDEEKQQMAPKETEKKLKGLEKERTHVTAQLKESLQRFEKLSADKSYAMILTEQRGHVKVLEKNAAGNEVLCDHGGRGYRH